MDEKLERIPTELADEIAHRERELNELRTRLGALSGVPAQSKNTAGSEAAKKTWAARKAKFEEYLKTNQGVTYEGWHKSLKTSAKRATAKK